MTRPDLVALAARTVAAQRGLDLSDHARIAEALNAPATFEPLTLTDAFALAAKAGATTADLQAAGDINPAILERLAAALAEGNHAGAEALVAVSSGVAPGLAGHLTAIVQGRARRALDEVAREAGYDASPHDASADDVRAALAS